jgi:hypothetical protein
MILNETMDLLKRVYGRKLRHITIDRLVVGPGAYHLFEACLRKINLFRESYKTFP